MGIIGWKKGFFCWLVMICDDDSNDDDDGILSSAGPTDRRNDQQINKVNYRFMCMD